jgi:UDPglucose 6-dehydrogenase
MAGLSGSRIGIIGSGVVGSATGKGLQKLGYDVCFYDIISSKLFSLKQEGYQVASNAAETITDSDILFVCVNTPIVNGRGGGYINKNSSYTSHQDLSQIFSVLSEISKAFGNTRSDKHHLIVFRSTLLPGTMRNVIVDYLQRNCRIRLGEDYDVCYNPEFLRQSSALEDFFKPDRIVIGEGSAGASYPLVEIFRPLTKNMIITHYEEAEMIKYASNCFLALKISYFNEIAMICRTLGIDDKQVNTAVALDNRIGSYGTLGGMPFGGACFPKDTAAMASFIKKLGLRPDLIEIALELNKEIKEISSSQQVIQDIDR